MVASCGGTTPSDSEYTQVMGTGSSARSRIFLARGCMVCAFGPIGWAISRYSAFTTAGDWLPSADTLTGLPSVMTLRTHSGA